MLPEVRKTYVDGPCGQVHCRVAHPAQATRAPVICLHMSPKSGRSFKDVLPYLAAERVAMAPDYPGHGESDPPPADPHVTVADFARSTWAVIDNLVDTPVHLVGYHTGAMVAVEATVQRPSDVLSITSISAPIFSDDEINELSSEFDPIPIDEDGTRFTTNWQRVMANRGPGVTLQMLAESFAENLRAGDDYEWGHRAAFAYASTYNKRIAEIEQPNFVINPNDDCFEATVRSDELIRNGHRRDFPDWGHGFLNAYPEEAAGVILEFINGNEPDD